MVSSASPAPALPILFTVTVTIFVKHFQLLRLSISKDFRSTKPVFPNKNPVIFQLEEMNMIMSLVLHDLNGEVDLNILVEKSYGFQLESNLYLEVPKCICTFPLTAKRSQMENWACKDHLLLYGMSCYPW